MKTPLLPLLALASSLTAADFHDWAPAPPMGWNSWDSFGCTLTENQALAQADAQVRLLKPFGWTLFTVDIQWYFPKASGHEYKAGAVLAMDAWGRLTPATNRFPSAAGGAGFKPLADAIHAKGLSFGIHILRGIPRQAVRANTPILGTALRASDIADTRDTCCWNPDMFGIDCRRPGAQEYYDSLASLYASWGVDFIKVDDISRPYSAAQRLEIEAVRKAIDKTGRCIVLSLSPGDTPVAAGAHVAAHANQWRISDDFWDQWPPLCNMFKRLHDWEPFRRPGAWPDADMLPFGKIDFGRDTRFTCDEQRTCMTLWCIARSPLILGSDLTRLDDWTLSLLTNREVIAVNQSGANPRQLSRDGNRIVWTSEAANGARYFALFNIGDTAETLSVECGQAVRNLWSGKNEGAPARLEVKLPPHGCALYRFSAK